MKRIKLSRVLTDRGTEYAAIPSITNMSSILPWKTSIIREPRRRAHKRMVSVSASTRRFSTSSIEWRSATKLYVLIADLQEDLDEWVRSYNEDRPHQGRCYFGKTQLQTFLDAICRSNTSKYSFLGSPAPCASARSRAAGEHSRLPNPCQQGESPPACLGAAAVPPGSRHFCCAKPAVAQLKSLARWQSGSTDGHCLSKAPKPRASFVY